jgi:hypothetical protein
MRGAMVLTLLAILAAAITGYVFIDFGLLAAVGIGQAIGVGAVATLGARRVADPQAERLGLRALDWKNVPIILCLAPAVLLASELDNFAADWSPPDAAIEAPAADVADAGTAALDANADAAAVAPDTASPGTAGKNLEEHGDGATTSDDEGMSGPHPAASSESGSEPEVEPLIDPENPWTLLQALIVMVGISPIVEEFLFRGVIQQGLVQRLGLVRGVTMVALLWTLLRPVPLAGFLRFFVAVVASFGLGWLLGIVRIATGSILGSVLLASVWATIGLGSLALEGRVDLPGMNVEGSHLPWAVSLASILIVAWASRVVYEQARQRDAEERRDRMRPSMRTR